MRPALLLIALAAPAVAEPLSPGGFESWATGRTLTYSQGGAVYGAEQYLPGRRVLWAFKGDECRRGQYYAQGDQVCFLYEDEPTPQCWTFQRDGARLTAHFAGDPDDAEPSTVGEMPGPLICTGPDVGV